jgi:HlyD family secretion protein
VDAFPNETFEGVVTLIATKGANVNNVITFDVKIQLTDVKALQLKPEMTANVTIEVAQKPNVVYLPNEAILHSPRGATVQKVVNNDNPKKPKTQEIPVTLGVVGDTQTEIIRGLRVGDVIVLDAVEPSSQWRRNGGPKDSSGQRNGQVGGGGGSRAMMRSMGR